MYNYYYLILFLFYTSGHGVPWNFPEWEVSEKCKRAYYNRPILKPTSFVTVPAIVRKAKMTPAVQFKGWKGER